MKVRHGVLGAALLLAVLPAVAAGTCDDAPEEVGIEAYCGIAAPEDIVRVGDSLIISSMAETWNLYRFALPGGPLEVLDAGLELPSPDDRWGDPACELPEALITHGIDIARRVNGQWQLLAVNHAGRESIEYFAVDDSGPAPVLDWRGCVMAAENTQFNDVAALPDGGFLATDPITASWQLAHMLGGALGMETGQVYRWRPDQGYEVVPHTRGAYPNGILLSADGERFYLNRYLDGLVQEHDLETGEVLRSVAVARPDNSSLAADGALLVASHDASVFTLLNAVFADAQERNEIPYRIVRIDPDTFTASVRFASDGKAMGGGTVAQEVGDELYIGAFRGDRILRVRVPAAP